MKYAVMSDVHANPTALAKALDDARSCGVDTYVCLGDIVGYGPSPDAAITLSREAFGNLWRHRRLWAVPGRGDSTFEKGVRKSRCDRQP